MKGTLIDITISGKLYGIEVKECYLPKELIYDFAVFMWILKI